MILDGSLDCVLIVWVFHPLKGTVSSGGCDPPYVRMLGIAMVHCPGKTLPSYRTTDSCNTFPFACASQDSHRT